ncbi:SNF2 family N-terminal domain-containing protein [Rhexocercosporidium sp. MPI-PUGE-AT-0058]|nr:SNF2 family N-terminal domain-containing protein [Rhexocercosporidium sp. MPI-PUGE-AT-0058]
MARNSKASTSPSSPTSRLSSTPPSSPPEQSPIMDVDSELDQDFLNDEEKAIHAENEKARLANEQQEIKQNKRGRKKAPIKDREAKASELAELLNKCEQFTGILKNNSKSLGQVGRDFEGNMLGGHNIEMSEQPGNIVGGQLRPYQLEGLTWMYDIAFQSMSGILADEMGLGKTIQTISLVAKLRESDYKGPFLIVAPMSTLSNWDEEFAKWLPSVPVVKYHGAPAHRQEIFKTRVQKNYSEEVLSFEVDGKLMKRREGRVTDDFPVVLTTPEIIMRDAKDLIKIRWGIIFIDEGHRLKNSESKLFRILQPFHSYSRFLITGTPLQNDLKELWSLLHFLLPTVFTEWELFEAYFDFSDLRDEKTTEGFLQEKKTHEMISKIQQILQPLLLRRIKADVEHLLPKKREYILYAPMTQEQTELCNVINDEIRDTREYLEEKVAERLTVNAASAPRKAKPIKPTKPIKIAKVEESDSEEDVPLAQLSIRKKPRGHPPKSAAKNAFEQMMKGGLAAKRKRTANDGASSPASKSSKSSRHSTPASNRGRKVRNPKSYSEAASDEEDALSDDEFEEKLAQEVAEKEETPEDELTPEEMEAARIKEAAKKEMSTKKLGNPLMQLRLACNSPHNFYNAWPDDRPVDETLVTASGKMLLLDRLLKSLFARGHKVLIFSQFKTQLDLIQDYAQELREWIVCRIDGSVSQEERQRQIKEFNENPNFKLFLLSTRAGGQGINLASADSVILFDSDWNPQQDLQAQDRAHRIGQKNPVIIYRLATKNTVEEALLLNADAKRRLEKLVIKKADYKSKGQKLRDEVMTKEALKVLLKKDGEVFTYKSGDQILSDEDLDVLTDRSEEAYVKAAKGLGDAEAFKIVETKVGGLMAVTGLGKKEEKE